MKTDFKLKNYTTAVPAEKSMYEIEQLLIKFGALEIARKYENGRIKAFAFRLPVLRDDGSQLPNAAKVILPCEADKTLALLRANGEFTRTERASALEHSERIAWRVVKDWLHSQLSLVLIGQAEPVQVFFPYLSQGSGTLYDKFKQSDYALLEGPRG